MEDLRKKTGILKTLWIAIIARESYEYLKKDQEPKNDDNRFCGSVKCIIKNKTISVCCNDEH